MSDSIKFKNHGVTLGLSRGKNLGVTIMSNGKMMNAQLEQEDVTKLLDWLGDSCQDLLAEYIEICKELYIKGVEGQDIKAEDLLDLSLLLDKTRKRYETN